MQYKYKDRRRKKLADAWQLPTKISEASETMPIWLQESTRCLLVQQVGSDEPFLMGELEFGARVGDWVVKHPDNRIECLSNDNFVDRFHV